MATVKEIKAYIASDETIHKTKQEAATATFIHEVSKLKDVTGLNDARAFAEFLTFENEGNKEAIRKLKTSLDNYYYDMGYTF